MQQDRHKTKEDTWNSEELRKHLKAMQSESSNEKRHKERRHHREGDGDERADSKHKSDRQEKRDRPDGSDRHAERRERHGYPDKERGERHGYPDKKRDHQPDIDRHVDRDREHRREKEKQRDTERHHISERHRTGEREGLKEKTYRGENAAKDHGTAELSRGERMVRESLEKSKHRSDDRERRHQEKREKEKQKQENEEHENRDARRSRHRKHREDLDSRDPEKDMERDRKHSKESDGDKRRASRHEKELRSNTEVRAAEDRRKEKHSKEKQSQREDRERGQGEKREQKAHANNEENRVHQKHSRESTSKQRSDNEKDIEETAQNTDATYDDSTNYEEDFEDYDDDFEEASEEEKTLAETQKERPPVQRNREVEEIQEAMLLENENITSVPAVYRHQNVQGHHDQDPESKEVSSSRKAHRGVFIDFGSAKQRQVSSQIASKQKKRSLEILRLIDLDFSSTFSLLDLAPVKEYEMYIRNFGKSNTKQAYVQCNDDAVDREIQTEEIDIEEKWTQHPAEGSVVCGGHKNDSEGNLGFKSQVDSQRLTGFLCSAAQVMAVLLEENRSEYQSRSKVHSKEPGMSISEGCFHLNTNLPFLQGRKVYHLQFSEAQRHLLLTVHGPSNQSVSAFLSDMCLICVWNIWQPSAPQQVLMCESEVKCCCFSPGKASLVFAGTVDGSVLVWDLREDFSMHQTLTIEDANWTFRYVTFSTDGVFTSVNHTHPVKSIEPVPSAEAKDPGISTLSSQGEELSGLSFQLASLDENGHLIFWVVVELRKLDLAGSQTDLGLIPGGKVKLIHSSSIDLIDKFFHKDVLSLGIPETMNIKFLPQDSNHFVIGTDIGIVTHGTRYGLIDPPVQYSSLHNKLRPSKVTAIDFSPFAIPTFLAGCSDGCIRLHTMSAEYSVMQWNDTTDGRSIIALQWSLTRPTMFFVLDAASTIHIWDLLQNDLQPVAKESITSDQVLSMSVFGEPEKNNNLMGLALAKASGKVEIQYIKKKWAKPQPKELEKLQLMLQEIL